MILKRNCRIPDPIRAMIRFSKHRATSGKRPNCLRFCEANTLANLFRKVWRGLRMAKRKEPSSSPRNGKAHTSATATVISAVISVITALALCRFGMQ